MNERDPAVQALRLARLLQMQWPTGSMLKKVDGCWMVLPVRKLPA